MIKLVLIRWDRENSPNMISYVSQEELEHYLLTMQGHQTAIATCACCGQHIASYNRDINGFWIQVNNGREK